MLDLASVSAGDAFKLWRKAVDEGDFDLADILCDLEMAIRGDHFEQRVEIETRLLPLMMARGI